MSDLPDFVRTVVCMGVVGFCCPGLSAYITMGVSLKVEGAWDCWDLEHSVDVLVWVSLVLGLNLRRAIEICTIEKAFQHCSSSP